MSSKKSKKKDKNIKTAVAVVAAIVVIIIIAKYAFPSGELAATVNGEKIYKEDVLREYLKVPVELRQVITAESILQGMIVEKLVIQEAAKLGISVSNAEIEDYLQDILNIYGVTEENLTQSLKENGLTLEEFKLSLKKKLTIDKVLGQTALADIDVTEGEIETYYVENMAQFKIPEYIKASHILVNTSKEAKSVRAKALGGVDFAELAEKHSIGPSASSGGDLGWFARGRMVEAFENAAFALDVGEISDVVETQFGFHIIKLTNRSAESWKTFDEVKLEIEQALIPQKQNDAINEYTSKLEQAADLQIFMGQEKAEPDYTMNVQQTVSVADDKPEEEPEQQQSSGSSLAECLSENGVKMYCPDSSRACKSQKEMLGDDFAGIDYVDCDADEDACDEAEISSYPTWIINGKKDVGKYSAEKLAELAGC